MMNNNIFEVVSTPYRDDKNIKKVLEKYELKIPFQPLIGTIKTPGDWYIKKLVKEFQPLIGTIKTMSRKTN